MKKNLFLTFSVLVLLSKGAEANIFPNALERFDIEDLKIARVEKDRDSGRFYGLVLDPDGYVYRVETGDRLGKDFGSIKRIDSCGIWFHEVRENKNGDWGGVDRVMFSKDASSVCKANLPKGVIPVAREFSEIIPKEQAEKNALKIYFYRRGWSASNMSPPRPRAFSIPLISGIYSFPFDDGWIVVIWDANQEIGMHHKENGKTVEEKKLIFEIFVLNKRGRVVKFGTNGPMPDN